MELFGKNPAKQIMLSFVSAIIMGSIILTLPISATGTRIGFIDALFTSTSAICVTGLTVVDMGKDYSLFGQIIIMFLIQLGGLGVMTFTTGLFLSLGTRISFGERLGLSQSLGGSGQVMAKSLIKAVVFITFVIEAIGALLLFFEFNHRLPPGKALFASIFHSVSAFCNAGFSIFSDNLESYSHNIPVILIIGFLIIFGGLGFLLIREILNKLRSRKSRFSLHAKLGLTGTVILIILGTAIFYLMEYKKAFVGLETSVALANAFFQSVTPRTAGFDTIPQPALTEISLMVTMILMFIGVCPGSTGGGIKITSMSVSGQKLGECLQAVSGYRIDYPGSDDFYAGNFRNLHGHCGFNACRRRS